MEQMQEFVAKLDVLKEKRFDLERQRDRDQMEIRKEENEILKSIRQNAFAVMVDSSPDDSATKGWSDNYNKEVSNLRANIEKDEGIRKIIGKIPIEDVALVKLNQEYVRDVEYEGNKTDHYSKPYMLTHPYRNRWLWDISYLYGGPGSPAKVLFREGHNGHRHICGVLLTSPSEVRKGPGKERQKKSS